MVFQNDIIAGASGAGGGYTIDQSIRFNDNDIGVSDANTRKHRRQENLHVQLMG